MDQALESTIDPACLQQPPLALDMIKQLDVFGLCLYSMLTFMACVSLLLYLEQCVFIYKKLSYPKTTTIIWISGAAPVISTMSCCGMWVPRAVMITDMTSNCYFAVVVYKVLVLLIEELGGSTDFLQRFSGKSFRINTGPCCCCCPCLPPVPVSRRMLFLLKLGSIQYAILKTAFSILSIILWTNGTFDLTNIQVTGPTLWINLFVGVLTIISLWPVGIVFMNINILLRSLKIIPKYAMYQKRIVTFILSGGFIDMPFLEYSHKGFMVAGCVVFKGGLHNSVCTELTLVLSQLQTSIINILSLNGSIACAPPLSSHARGSMLSQQIMIMEMFIISIVCRSLYRRIYDPLPSEEHDKEQNDKAALQTALEDHDV